MASPHNQIEYETTRPSTDTRVSFLLITTVWFCGGLIFLTDLASYFWAWIVDHKDRVAFFDELVDDMFSIQRKSVNICLLGLLLGTAGLWRTRVREGFRYGLYSAILLNALSLVIYVFRHRLGMPVE